MDEANKSVMLLLLQDIQTAVDAKNWEQVAGAVAAARIGIEQGPVTAPLLRAEDSSNVKKEWQEEKKELEKEISALDDDLFRLADDYEELQKSVEAVTTEMEKFQVSLAETAACPICFRSFDNKVIPNVGSCGHTICGRCRFSLEPRDCPICRRWQSFRYPNKNYLADQLIGLINQTRAAEPAGEEEEEQEPEETEQVQPIPRAGNDEEQSEEEHPAAPPSYMLMGDIGEMRAAVQPPVPSVPRPTTAPPQRGGGRYGMFPRAHPTEEGRRYQEHWERLYTARQELIDVARQQHQYAPRREIIPIVRRPAEERVHEVAARPQSQSPFPPAHRQLLRNSLSRGEEPVDEVGPPQRQSQSPPHGQVLRNALGPAEPVDEVSRPHGQSPPAYRQLDSVSHRFGEEPIYRLTRARQHYELFLNEMAHRQQNQNEARQQQQQQIPTVRRAAEPANEVARPPNRRNVRRPVEEWAYRVVNQMIGGPDAEPLMSFFDLE